MQQRSEETRKRILDTASQLFSQAGYEATGVAEICQHAGISKGAFYHHFPAKQSVFLAILEGWMNRLDTAFQFGQQNEYDITHAIFQMANTASSIFKEADPRLSILLEFWVQAQRDPAIWQAAVAPYRRYQAYFSDLIQNGIFQGSIRPVDPDHTARTLVALAIGFLMQALFDPHGADWAEEVPASIHLLLDGIARS
jgi:AcrR family transcriptional regulator